MSGPVTVKPAFNSAFVDTGDTTRLGPTEWNKARLFSGGADGDVIVRDVTSPTGAAWSASPFANLSLTSLSLGTNPASAGVLRLPNNSYITGRNQANSADVNLFRVGTTNLIEAGVQIDGTTFTATSLFSGPQFTATGSGGFSAPAGGFFSVTGRGFLSATADGVWMIQNAAGTAFTRWMFGGSSSSFPALTRNGAVLETKLADNSAYATHAALLFQTMTAIVAAGGGAAPTFTTIGGSGPATAAQNGWLKFTDSGGAACYCPVWK